MRRRGKPDEIDFKILDCMLAGYSNQVIANRIKKPLSTVQRRTRRLLQSGLIKHTYELDYQKLGYKKGLLHIYLNNGNPRELAEKMLLSKISCQHQYTLAIPM